MEPDQPESSAATKATGGSVIAGLLSSQKKNGPVGTSDPELDLHSTRRTAGITLEEVQQPSESDTEDWFDRKTYERLEKPSTAHPNQRRGHFALKVWAGSALFSLLLMGGFGLLLHHFYQERIETRLGRLHEQLNVVSPGIQSQLSDAERAAQTSTKDLADLKQTMGQLRSDFRTEVDGLKQSLSGISRQIDELRRADTTLEGKIAEASKSSASLSDSLQPLQSRLQTLDSQVNDLALHIGQLQPDGSKPAMKPDTAGAEPLPASSSANDELVLLKERNRLTLRADEAMATGKAEPLRALWKSLRDPELANLKHAAAAEIIRVQNHLDHLTRLPPDYKVPVKEYFPAAASDKDADLPATSLISLLLDSAKPLAARARAARLLSGKRSMETGEALLKAMRTDPELDVVKEAQYAMHDTFKFAVPLFDTLAAESWWDRNKATATQQQAQSSPPATGSSAPKP